MRGKLVVFEGIDGSGKGTQVKLLGKTLAEKKISCSTYAYPDDGGEAGKLLRRFLRGEFELGVDEQFMLYSIDILKDKKEIEEKLKKGKWVLMERYVISTVAYQCSKGFGLGRALKLVKSFGFIAPDVAVWLDVKPGDSIRRKVKQNGKLERFEKQQAFLGNVNAMYAKLMRKKAIAKKWKRIDGRKGKGEIAGEIQDFLF